MQPIKYRLAVRGLKAGQAMEPAAAALARLLRREPAEVAALLGSDRRIVLKLPDLAAAERYQALLAGQGCDCAIDPDPDATPQPAAAVVAATPLKLKAEPPPLVPPAAAPPRAAKRPPPAASPPPARSWTLATPTRRRGPPLSLGSLTAFVVVFGAYLLLRHHGSGPQAEATPPLPPALAAIRCTAPRTSYAFARLGTLGVYMPCSTAEDKMAIAKRWHDDKLTPAQVLASRMPVEGPFGWDFYYKRLPEGGFTGGGQMDLFPEAQNELYTLTVVFITPRPGMDQLPRPEGAGWYHDPWDVTVPLPSAFGAADDMVTFHCDGPQHASGYAPQGQYYCIGQFKAAPGMWRLILRFGRPMPQDIDLPGAFGESLDLAAAHIGPPASP